MERRISVRRFFALILFVNSVGAIGADSAYGEESLVLVAGENSPIVDLNSLEIRKLYLGFNVRDRDDHQIHAVTNASDEKVMRIFLQNVMAMSARTYSRRLLTLAVQTGQPRPRSEASLSELHSLLNANGMVVTCMWNRDVEKFGDLKVLKVLWTE
jgi:hypothetical protein